jgi:hypothetical protein
MKRLVDMDPSKPIGYYLFGLLKEANAKPAEAMEAIRTAMERDPYDIHFINRYAIFLANYGTMAQGIEFLDERERFFAAKGLSGFSAIIGHYKACLETAPEEDGANADSLNAITSDPYRSTVSL